MSDPKAFEIDPTAWTKFDSGLRKALHRSRGDRTTELPVLVVLAASEDLQPQEGVGKEARVRRAIAQQAAFERESASLMEEMERLGARDLQPFWINRTISARLTLPVLEAIGRRQEVRQIVLADLQKVIAEAGDKED